MYVPTHGEPDFQQPQSTCSARSFLPTAACPYSAQSYRTALKQHCWLFWGTSASPIWLQMSYLQTPLMSTQVHWPYEIRLRLCSTVQHVVRKGALRLRNVPYLRQERKTILKIGARQPEALIQPAIINKVSRSSYTVDNIHNMLCSSFVISLRTVLSPNHSLLYGLYVFISLSLSLVHLYSCKQ